MHVHQDVQIYRVQEGFSMQPCGEPVLSDKLDDVCCSTLLWTVRQEAINPITDLGWEFQINEFPNDDVRPDGVKHRAKIHKYHSDISQFLCMTGCSVENGGDGVSCWPAVSDKNFDNMFWIDHLWINCKKHAVQWHFVVIIWSLHYSSIPQRSLVASVQTHKWGSERCVHFIDFHGSASASKHELLSTICETSDHI